MSGHPEELGDNSWDEELDDFHLVPDSMLRPDSYHSDNTNTGFREFFYRGMIIASVPIPLASAEKTMMETMLYKFIRQEPESKTMKDFVEIGIMMGRKL